LEENYNDSKVSGVTVLKCTDVLEFGSPGGGWVFLSSVSERKGCMERLAAVSFKRGEASPSSYSRDIT